MHVYDLMENSTAANSTEVQLTIKDSLKDNIYAFTIRTNILKSIHKKRNKSVLILHNLI